jgi:hypothetical protein
MKALIELANALIKADRNWVTKGGLDFKTDVYETCENSTSPLTPKTPFKSFPSSCGGFASRVIAAIRDVAEFR